MSSALDGRRRQHHDRYPHSPGHKGESDTGRAAAVAFGSKAKPIRERTRSALQHGAATAEQVADAIGEHFMIVRARCSELRAQGLIDDSGQRGDGALGGKVIVWRITTQAERAILNARKAAEVEKMAANL